MMVLYLLMLSPLLLLIIRRFRRQKVQKISDLSWQKRFFERKSLIPPLVSRFLLASVGLLLLAALFLPQLKSDLKKETSWGKEVILVADTSGSMGFVLLRGEIPNLAGQPLELTASLIQKLIEIRKNDSFGLITFSNEGTWIRNFSRDQEQILSVFQNHRTLYYLSGGTNVHLGLLEAREVLENLHPVPTKIVVLLSDLEDFNDNALVVLEAMLKDGFYIIVVAIGSSPSYLDDIRSPEPEFVLLRETIESLVKSQQHLNLYYFEYPSKENLEDIANKIDSVLEKIPSWEIKLEKRMEEKQLVSDRFVFVALGFLFSWVAFNFLYPKVP